MPRQSGVLAPTGDLAALVERVVAIIEAAQTHVSRVVNSSAVLAAWHVGREIVEYVQKRFANAGGRRRHRIRHTRSAKPSTLGEVIASIEERELIERIPRTGVSGARRGRRGPRSCQPDASELRARS